MPWRDAQTPLGPAPLQPDEVLQLVSPVKCVSSFPCPGHTQNTSEAPLINSSDLILYLQATLLLTTI